MHPDTPAPEGTALPQEMGACAAGGDHLEHIWPVEPYDHAAAEDCICEPEFLTDEDGFFWLHHRVAPEEVRNGSR
jgi:hypothetical protein